MNPHFFYISDKTNSSSYSGKSFTKKINVGKCSRECPYRVEIFTLSPHKSVSLVDCLRSVTVVILVVHSPQLMEDLVHGAGLVLVQKHVAADAFNAACELVQILCQ